MDVCTYNAGNARQAPVSADFQRLCKQFPLIGCQEVADRAREMNAGGHQVLTQDGQDKGHVALLVSPAVKINTWGYVSCTSRSKVGAWGAGPKVIAAKWIVWANVTVDGQAVTVATTHMVPSVQRKAKGPVAKAGLARRRALYRKHIAAVVAWAEATPGPLVITADWNATSDFPLLRPLADAGLVCSSAPSHGDRDIDQLWSRGMTPEAVDALKGFSSDHKPVAVTYTIPEEPPVTNPAPFDKVTFRGRLMDNKTMYGLMVAEQRLGYELTVTQGCYNPGGVSASAGTHDGGGVVDLAPYDYQRKVRVMRDLGWAAWHRSPSEGPWAEHIHCVMIDHGTLSASAAAQVVSYKAGRNGLANNAADPDPYRPDPIPVFDYQAALRDVRIRTRITGLQAQVKKLRDRISANRARITYKGKAKP